MPENAKNELKLKNVWLPDVTFQSVFEIESGTARGRDIFANRDQNKLTIIFRAKKGVVGDLRRAMPILTVFFLLLCELFAKCSAISIFDFLRMCSP